MDTKASVLQYLKIRCLGRDSAVKARDLGTAFGISLRAVNDVVRELRKDGVMVGSSKREPYGYYLPSNSREIKEYLAEFRAELFDMLKTYNIQRRAKDKHLEDLSTGSLFDLKIGETGQFSLV